MQSDKEALRARAEWIWNDRRIEWIEFWRQRWASFWQKTAAGCKRAGEKVEVNQPWTRDPYEVIYRYGLDYIVSNRDQSHLKQEA
jgi:hypothetical protein